MTRKEKVAFVMNELDQLYPEIPISLDHTDPYTLLIAVLLSAQSTDVRVNKITSLLFKQANTPHEMIKLSVEEIREIIKPVGLSPIKSKGIHGLSHILINKHGVQLKKFPDDVLEAMAKYAKEVIAETAAGDDLTGRIYDSYKSSLDRTSRWNKIGVGAYRDSRDFLSK